jgi:voltage-gated potassium channel
MMQSEEPESTPANGEHERWVTLRELENWLERPMLVLSFVWLLLVLVELVYGVSAPLEVFGTAIWAIFIAEFALRFALAPRKSAFLRSNWVTAVALLVPALRLLRGLRALQVLRAGRGLRLVKVVGTANRGMNALSASFGRRGIGYVLAATVLVDLLGAAGMLAFEPSHEVPGGFATYWDALWWTSMLITTMGSQFWPQTMEGRILCFLMSVYGLAVFGYITASLASFFVGRDAPDTGERLSESEIELLRREIESLRNDIRRATSGERR